MAKQKNNVVTHGLSGNVGDLLIFRQTSTGTVVADMPDSIANEGRYDRMN